MDDKTRGVGGGDLSGRGDDYISGREEPIEPRSGSRGALRAGSRTGGTSPDTTRDVVATPAADAGAADRTRRLRREIDQTREDMSETVEEIQERLRPRSIASNAAESLKSTTRDAVRDVAESEPVQYVRANPIPTAMIGIGVAGLAWLAFGAREPGRVRSRSARGGARDWSAAAAYDDADEYDASSIAGRPAEAESAGAYSPGMSYDTTAERLTSRASGAAQDVRRRAERTTRRARTQLNRTWQENPLLMGAASAIGGLIVGLAIPETERENQLMGDTRDEVVEGVQQKVRSTVNRVQDAAKGAVRLSGDEGGQK